MKERLRLPVRFISGFALVAAIIFVPAGTARFANGWILLAALMIPIAVVGLVLIRRNPELLAKRLETKETDPAQRLIVAGMGTLIVAAFLLAGLDYRFGWSRASWGWSLAATAVYLAGYGLYIEAMRENVWISRTVRVESEQRVVDTGLYGIVRHPMYTAVSVMFPMFGLILGSWLSFLLLLAGIFPLIALRIRSEEETLRNSLGGYADYMEKVRFRLIPGAW